MRSSLFAALFLALTLSGTAQAQDPVIAQSTPQSFEVLAEKLLPTVVNISTTTKIEPRDGRMMPDLPQLPPGSPFEEFFKEFYDQYKNMQPPPGAPGGDDKVSALGSGFVIDAQQGYVVTNNHVIKDADEIRVILHDDTSLDATLVGVDDKTDLAVLKVKPDRPLVAAQWGDSDTAKVGSWVVAIGNPFGLGGTVTAGIVSARQRNINAGPYDDFIQTDASINRGNSGGPMFNTQGQVVGVNTAIFSPSGGSVGIGFAVPSNIAKSVVSQLIKYGKTKRGWLGVRIQEVTPDIAESIGMGKPRGALVSSTTPKGPSEEAGIKSGDVITSFDGQPIDQMRKLPRIVAESEVGKKVPVTVWRKEGEKTLTVTLGQLEKAEEETAKPGEAEKTDQAAPTKTTELKSLGLTVAPLDAAAREKSGLGKDVAGVLITTVARDSSAAEKGLMAGDVIAEIDQQDVATPEDLAAKIAAAEKAGRSSLLLFVIRKDDRRFVAVKLKAK